MLLCYYDTRGGIEQPGIVRFFSLYPLSSRTTRYRLSHPWSCLEEIVRLLFLAYGLNNFFQTMNLEKKQFQYYLMKRRAKLFLLTIQLKKCP